jgi:hypothetical protein
VISRPPKAIKEVTGGKESSKDGKDK